LGRIIVIILSLCILLIGVVLYWLSDMKKEFKELETKLFPIASKYNGTELNLEYQLLVNNIYLSITFESTGDKVIDRDNVLNLAKLAIETPAKELLIWIYKDGNLNQVIEIERKNIEKWMNDEININQFLNSWDKSDVKMK
jgi:hypothetical protein